MSFILDALKKSESDRQRQSGPSLFEVKVAPPRRTLPIWAVAIAVLLGINAVVISWMLLRRGPAPQPAAAAAPAAAPAPVKTAGTAAPMMSTETAPTSAAADSAPGANTAPAASQTASRTASQAAGPAAASGRSAPGSAHPPQAAMGTASAAGAGPPPTAAPPAGSPDQGAAQPPSGENPSDYAPAVEPAAAQASGTSGGGSEALPLYQQIVTSANLPALHLDLHVFAARPKDRFVMINMTRVGEGASLPNGVQVEAIRPDGVVLSYHGTRFLLPRN